jgi:S1-C subfamily serine protease
VGRHLLGESIAALGFPLGLPLTVTRRTVSETNRMIRIDGVRVAASFRRTLR